MSFSSGILFENRRKTNSQPEYLGKIVVGGVAVSVVGYLSADKDGKEVIKIKKSKY